MPTDKEEACLMRDVATEQLLVQPRDGPGRGRYSIVGNVTEQRGAQALVLVLVLDAELCFGG